MNAIRITSLPDVILHKEDAALHCRSAWEAPRPAQSWAPTTNPASPNRRMTPWQNILVHYLFHHQCCGFVFLPGIQGKSTWNAWQRTEAPEIVNTIELKPMGRSIWLKDKYSHSIHAWPKTNWESRHLCSLPLHHDLSSAVLETFPTNAVLQHCDMVHVPLWDDISHRKHRFWRTALSKHSPISPFSNWSNSGKFTPVMSGWEARKGGKTVSVFLPLPVRQHCTAHCPWETGTYQSIYKEIINSKLIIVYYNLLLFIITPWHWQGEFPALLWHVSPSPHFSQPTTSPLWLNSSVAEGEAAGGRTHSPAALALHWAVPPHPPGRVAGGCQPALDLH